MAKSFSPTTMIGRVERYLVQHKRMAVGDAEDDLGIRPDQLYRVIYDLKKLGYPIKTEWVTNSLHENFVIYSIPHNWSKKSLNK